MSRIDDEIDDRRAADLLFQKQLQEELSAKKKTSDVSEFDRRMLATNVQRQAQTYADLQHHVAEDAEVQHDTKPADVLREAKERAKVADGDTAQHVEGQVQGDRQAVQRKQSGQQKQDAITRKNQSAQDAVTKRESVDRTDGQRVERRNDSYRFGEDLRGHRSDGELKKEDGQSSSMLPQASDDERAVSRDTGDGGSKGGGSDNKGGNDAPPNFRLNPALLAPPPLAQPKDNTRTEKMRKLANEIAQKIVERARVGRNAAGQAEFQLELRSNVLSGLNIKVSASGGRISALFSGNDRKVLDMLKDSADNLKQALQSRGLTLVELKIEASR